MAEYKTLTRTRHEQRRQTTEEYEAQAREDERYNAARAEHQQQVMDDTDAVLNDIDEVLAETVIVHPALGYVALQNQAA